MKTVWKWILGIVIVLIVVAALVGGFVMMRNYRMTTFAQRYQQFSQQVPNWNPRSESAKRTKYSQCSRQPWRSKPSHDGTRIWLWARPDDNGTWANDDGSRL